MIEHSQRPVLSSASELEILQRRASNQRARHQRASQPIAWHSLFSRIPQGPTGSLQIPTRIILHAVVALVLPVALLLSQLPPGALVRQQEPTLNSDSSAEIMIPLAPLSIDTSEGLGDAPLPDDADIPIPLSMVSQIEAFQPVVVTAQIAGERVNLRNGPGTEYDIVTRVTGETPIQVIGRYGDWFQIRQQVNVAPLWVSGELLNIDETAASTLFDVDAALIPPPPPPKIALVRESGLLLRDGPGTNYVPLTKLDASAKLDLFEIYQNWFHVGLSDGTEGWVKGEFLQIEAGVIERLLVADAIPDPNPALVGKMLEDQVNLRKGPDSRYAKVGTINSGITFDLIGKYEDWIRIRLTDGTKAWVFGDLVAASSHVMRRVPVSKDFPALPVAAKSKARSGGNSANLALIPASGDVASFAVQFVGYRYRWGAASPSKGFDCSGLTSYVYAQHGIKIPRTAAAQYSTSVGARVGSIDSLAPGDLVFFANTGGRRGISHVGIYIGGGRIVHAMTPRYGVQISSLYERYWSSHFAGGIRPRR